MMVGASHQYGGHQMSDPGEMTFALGGETHHSATTASLLDAIERRTQRTYRYGIALVCIGATLNWLGFAQGNSYIDPLRYLGVACVISGSFCVCLAMCRWLGRPISVSGHRLSSLEEDSLSGITSGEVHVINVAVPMYIPSMHEEYRGQKPPDYEIVAGEPPPYDEAIKLTPGSLLGQSDQCHHHHCQISDHPHCHQCHHHPQGSVYQISCAPSPSHSTNSSTPLLIQNEGSSRKASITSEINPGSPPPPYHPSPSRFIGVNENSTSITNDHLISNELRTTIRQPLVHGAEHEAHSKYHMSAEQEHLLGLMMRGQRCEQGSLALTHGSTDGGGGLATPSSQNSSSHEGGNGENFSILNESGRNELVIDLSNSINSNHLLPIPIIMTDGNGNSSPILLDIHNESSNP